MSRGSTDGPMQPTRNREIAGSNPARGTDSLKTSERIHELETALNRMVTAHEITVGDTEGRWPALDSGCIECTQGATPDRYNTGLCAYHNAKRLLRHG